MWQVLRVISFIVIFSAGNLQAAGGHSAGKYMFCIVPTAIGGGLLFAKAWIIGGVLLGGGLCVGACVYSDKLPECEHCHPTRVSHSSVVEPMEAVVSEQPVSESPFEQQETVSQILYPECTICMESLDIDSLGEKFVELSCGHVFHNWCLASWWSQKPEHCPNCNDDLRKTVARHFKLIPSVVSTEGGNEDINEPLEQDITSAMLY